MTFILDSRLDNDCFKLAETADSLWLLLNNSHFPWFIIVPKTEVEELYLLSTEVQTRLMQQNALLSEFVVNHFACDKLNVAAIGNIVNQMHLHIIARTKTDPCWPGVVWGTEFKAEYSHVDVLEIQNKLKQFCQQKNIQEIEFAPAQ